MAMPVRISKSLVAKLPENERENVEQVLWDKSGGRCFLCEEPINRAADELEADHDVPEAEGGKTELANLNIAHVSCNRAKRNAKTIPVRPYLKLAAFARRNGGRLRYDGFLTHFEIKPSPVYLSRNGDDLTIEFPNGERVSAPILKERNATAEFEYVFMTVPRDAIFNDDAVQPRTLRLDHAWSIYSDLQRNPLHEPPSCRVELYKLNEPIRLLMFDGQHKTVANWMMERKRVTAKIYLNLSTDQAVLLVNSIQAKIKKLPLSPFELAAKMSDEWENKWREYETAVGISEVSEDGFLKWLPPTERPRGKQALQSALVQSVLASPDLRIVRHVKRPGAPTPTISFTEQTLKTKLIERLLARSALRIKGPDGQATRDREAGNIVFLLNLLNDHAFEPDEEATSLTKTEIERGRRMTYQSSLSYIANLMRRFWIHKTLSANPVSPIDDSLGENQLAEIRKGVERLVNHPVWTADFDRDKEMQGLKVALEKNQEVPGAFEKLGFDLAYLVLGDESSNYRNHWIEDA